MPDASQGHILITALPVSQALPDLGNDLIGGTTGMAVHGVGVQPPVELGPVRGGERYGALIRRDAVPQVLD